MAIFITKLDRTPIIDEEKVNYFLRVMYVSKGKREIIFRYEPKVIENAGKITLGSYGVFGLAVMVMRAMNFSIEKDSYE